MKRTTGLLAAVVILASIGGAGCVSQQEVDRLQSLYRKSQEQVVDLRTQLEEAEARIDALQSQQPDGSEIAALEEQLRQARAERDELAAALDAAERQLREAGSPLEIPEELSDALANLAAEYPDLMTYDEDLGMVQLRSDLTFDLGSADVRDNARASLQRLADVLTSNAARQFEIRVVGHTDSVPIQRPETRANHPTNWHLSAHRAIAVKDVLQGAGIAPRRFNVAGYGPYRPLVAEEQGEGAEANRRVEIYLVPMTRREQQQMNRVDGGQAQNPAPQQQPAANNTNEDPAQFK